MLVMSRRTHLDEQLPVFRIHGGGFVYGCIGDKCYLGEVGGMGFGVGGGGSPVKSLYRCGYFDFDRYGVTLGRSIAVSRRSFKENQNEGGL